MKYVNIIDFQTRAQSIKCLLFNREELPRPAYQYLHTNLGGLDGLPVVPALRRKRQDFLGQAGWREEPMDERQLF